MTFAAWFSCSWFPRLPHGPIVSLQPDASRTTFGVRYAVPIGILDPPAFR